MTLAARTPHGPHVGWGRRLRPTILLAATLAGLTVLATACDGGSPSASIAGSGSGTTTTIASSSGGGSDPQQRQAALVKFAGCMRSHGVSSFPDPSQGFLNLPPGVNPSSPQFQ